MATESAANLSMEEILDQSDLSDKEDAETLDLTPFKVDWLELPFGSLGICALPGCRFRLNWRSLVHDIAACLKDEGIQDVFCLCTKGELHLYRTPELLNKYKEAGFTVHHYPVLDGQVPVFADLMKIIDDISQCIVSGKKCIVHCFGGLGRSSIVAACLLMTVDQEISPDDVKKKIQALKGDAAIQSVKQYNLLTDFRDLLKAYREDNNSGGTGSRSVSR